MVKKTSTNRNPASEKGGAQSTKPAAKKKINVKIPSKG